MYEFHLLMKVKWYYTCLMNLGAADKQVKGCLDPQTLKEYRISDPPYHDMCSESAHNCPLSPVVCFDDLRRSPKIEW